MARKEARKSFLWRLDSDKDREKISRWMDNQVNITNSLKTLIFHFTDKYGDENVTDYEIIKALNHELITGHEKKTPTNSQLSTKASSEPENNPESDNDKDDNMYEDLDVNDL